MAEGILINGSIGSLPIAGDPNASITVKHIQVGSPLIDYTGSSDSLANTTWKTLYTSSALNKGVYIVAARVNFNANATGRREVYLGTNSSGNVPTACTNATNNITAIQCTRLIDAEQGQTIYVRGYQNSGGNLGVSVAEVKIIQIS